MSHFSFLYAQIINKVKLEKNYFRYIYLSQTFFICVACISYKKVYLGSFIATGPYIEQKWHLGFKDGSAFTGKHWSRNKSGGKGGPMSPDSVEAVTSPAGDLSCLFSEWGLCRIRHLQSQRQSLSNMWLRWQLFPPAFLSTFYYFRLAYAHMWQLSFVLSLSMHNLIQIFFHKKFDYFFLDPRTFIWIIRMAILQFTF